MSLAISFGEKLCISIRDNVAMKGVLARVVPRAHAGTDCVGPRDPLSRRRRSVLTHVVQPTCPVFLASVAACGYSLWCALAACYPRAPTRLLPTCLLGRAVAKAWFLELAVASIGAPAC